MNQTITIFTYENTNIRTTTEDGTPLFCGKDVAITLGYKDTTNALKLHCKGVVKHHPRAHREKPPTLVGRGLFFFHAPGG